MNTEFCAVCRLLWGMMVIGAEEGTIVGPFGANILFCYCFPGCCFCSLRSMKTARQSHPQHLSRASKEAFVIMQKNAMEAENGPGTEGTE